MQIFMRLIEQDFNIFFLTLFLPFDYTLKYVNAAKFDVLGLSIPTERHLRRFAWLNQAIPDYPTSSKPYLAQPQRAPVHAARACSTIV
jgi:hypothetical protein